MSPSASRRLLLASMAALQGCVYLPRTVERYDRDCNVMARHVVLEQVQLGAIQGCVNQGCAALVIAASVTTAASLIISGSITVVGNIAYWVEKRANCQGSRPEPEASPPNVAPWVLPGAAS